MKIFIYSRPLVYDLLHFAFFIMSRDLRFKILSFQIHIITSVVTFHSHVWTVSHTWCINNKLAHGTINLGMWMMILNIMHMLCMIVMTKMYDTEHNVYDMYNCHDKNVWYWTLWYYYIAHNELMHYDCHNELLAQHTPILGIWLFLYDVISFAFKCECMCIEANI